MANLKCKFKLFRDPQWKVSRPKPGSKTWVASRNPLFADPWTRWPHGLSPNLCDKESVNIISCVEFALKYVIASGLYSTKSCMIDWLFEPLLHHKDQYTTATQARNQLASPGGAKSFLRGVQIFWTMSNNFKRCPIHFSKGVENFSRRGCAPRLRACCYYKGLGNLPKHGRCQLRQMLVSTLLTVGKYYSDSDQ